MIISTAKKVFAFHNTLFNSFIYVFSRLNLNFSTNHNFHYFPKRINNKNYNNNLSRYHLGHIHQQKVLMECSHRFGYLYSSFSIVFVIETSLIVFLIFIFAANVNYCQFVKKVQTVKKSWKLL